MTSLVSYDLNNSSSSDNDDDHQELNYPPVKMNLPPIISAPQVNDAQFAIALQKQSAIDSSSKSLNYNAKYNQLFAPKVGPDNPFKPNHGGVDKNFLTGRVEDAHLSDGIFEIERKTFHVHGSASNPSDHARVDSKVVNTSSGLTAATRSKTVTVIDSQSEDVKLSHEEEKDEDKEIVGIKEDKDETGHDLKVGIIDKYPPKQKNKRKKNVNKDSADIDGFSGPWADFVDEVKTAKPSEEELAEIEVFMSKKKKYTAKNEEKEVEEKCQVHITDVYDYQGRSFLHVPQDLDVNLRPDHEPGRCFLPKRVIHTYTGHTKAITTVKWLPRSAHLFLSCSMDAKIKLWEVYKERRCIMTFMGHKQAVKDIAFNRRGDRFISSGYDRAIKLWDTETGQCIKKFSNRKVAYSVKFNTDDERSHLFLSGMSDKKILCWDTRSAHIVQEYDRHLGAINTVTIVDNNRRFVSTSDDKSLRVWEWDIPVDVKYIAEPNMHAIPAVTASPNGKWLACQCMDNKIQAFACMNRFKLNTKKVYSGHMVAGYSCSPDFSPDMSYLISGDADGKVFIWDWKTTKLLTHFQAHDNVCICVLWHPHETSKVLTAGWDNNIKLWD